MAKINALKVLVISKSPTRNCCQSVRRRMPSSLRIEDVVVRERFYMFVPVQQNVGLDFARRSDGYNSNSRTLRTAAAPRQCSARSGDDAS